MEGPGFGLEVEHRDGTLVLSLRGELDLATAPVAAFALQRLRMQPDLTIDLAGVTFIDSAGVAALATAAAERELLCRRTTLVPAAPEVMAPLELAGPDLARAIRQYA